MPLSTLCSIDSVSGVKSNLLATAFISSANFALPSTLGSITIQGITGNYTSFTVTRTGGGLANYTSPTQTFPTNSFTDPTALVNNAQYTYTITPVYNSVTGTAFSGITNLMTNVSNGQIYSLATVTGLAVTRNDAGGNVNQISFTYTGTNNGTSNNYTSLSIQYPAGNEISRSNFVLGSNTFTVNVSYLPNTQYTHSIYAVNGDGLLYNTAATITTCTWAQFSSVSFTAPTALTTNTISIGTAAGAGTWTSYTIFRGPFGGSLTSLATAQTITTYPDTSGLASNTRYSYALYATNALGYTSPVPFTNITNPNNASVPGSIFTLASTATLALTYAGATSTTINVSFTWIGTLTNFASLSIQTSTAAGTGVLSTPAYATTTQTFTTTTNAYTPNSQVTLYVFAVNGDSVGSGVTYAQASVNTCTLAQITAASFSSPSALTSITIGSITGTYTSFNVYRGGSSIASAQTGTTYTNNTGLANNTQYTYSLYPINALLYASTTAFTSITNPNNGGTAGSIYTLATVSGLNPTYSGASSATGSVYMTWTSNGYTTLYLANTTKGGGNYTASGTAYNSTTNGSSDSALSTNTTYVYTFSTRNGDGFYVANSNCQTTLNTCTWGSCNAPTFSSTTTTGTTLACSGTFSGVYITYSGAGSPASGTTVSGTNSISQAYTTMSSGTPYTFNCFPVNALSYQSSNSASAGVTTTAAGNNPPSAPTLGYSLSTGDVYWSTGQGASCCSDDGVYAYFFSWNNSTLTNCTYTNNSGSTWNKVSVTPLASWYSNVSTCCCSSNGQIVYAAGGIIAVSTNYGVSWTQVANQPAGSIQGIQCSSSGTTLYMSIYSATNAIRSSTNASSNPTGASWAISYTGNLGQQLGMRINPNNTIMYQYRMNYLNATTWYIGYQVVTGTTIGTATQVTISGQANLNDNASYNSTSHVHGISNDGTCYAVGTYRTTTNDHRGFIWSTNSGVTCTVYADSGVQHVAIKGDGTAWIAVGASGIKYSSTKFTGSALTQGPSTVTTLVQVIAAPNANRYYACTTNAIYWGTYY